MESILLWTNSHDLTSYHRNTTLPSETSLQSEMTKKVVGEQIKRWSEGWTSVWQHRPITLPLECTLTAPSLKVSIPLLSFRLLYSVLPPSVANELRHKRPVPAKRYDNVTILFSGIVGFNVFCSKHASAEGAIKIVNLLNDVYTRFDILTDSRNNPYVYKVGRTNFSMTVYNTFVYIFLSKGIKREEWVQ